MAVATAAYRIPESRPQWLKPRHVSESGGTTEVVPFPSGAQGGRVPGLFGYGFFLQAVLRCVVAFAVDGGDLGAHGSQVHGKLSSMVDGVIHRNLDEGDCRNLEYAAKVDHPGQRFTAGTFEVLKILGKDFVKPSGNSGRVCDRLRAVDWSEIKRTYRYATEETFFRCHDMPCKLQSGFGNSVGTIVALVRVG